MEFVYCAVRIESLTTILFNFCLITVSRTRWLVTGFSLRRPSFDTKPVRVRVLVGKVALGHVSLRVLCISPVSITPPITPYSSSSTCCSYEKDKRAKSGNIPKMNDFFKKNMEALDRNILSFFFALKG